jgi:hypothetical protein
LKIGTTREYVGGMGFAAFCEPKSRHSLAKA